MPAKRTLKSMKRSPGNNVSRVKRSPGNNVSRVKRSPVFAKNDRSEIAKRVMNILRAMDHENLVGKEYQTLRGKRPGNYRYKDVHGKWVVKEKGGRTRKSG